MIENDEYLLCNFEEHNPFEELNGDLWNCEWKNIIKNNTIIVQIIKNNLEFKVEKDHFKITDVLVAGASSLLGFMQENFTGPYLNGDINDIFGIAWPDGIDSLNELSVDGEDLNPNTRKSELLLLGKIIIENLCDRFDYSFIAQWWYMRLILIHQNVLDDTTNSLYLKFVTISDKILSTIDTLEDIKLQSLLIAEIMQGYFLFRRVVKAETLLEKNISLLGIDLHVEGILGLRTKFQVKPLPILALKVKYDNPVDLIPANETHTSTILPNLLKLDDDVRLEKVEFIEKDNNTIMEFSSVIQSVILTKLQLTILSQPKDKLADEEIEPYITSLLYQQHGPFPIRLATLLIAIKQDATHKRTVDRSLKQMEQLVQLINEVDTPLRHRLSFIFASGLNTRWIIESKLADIMLSLGLVKSALDIYLRIQMWEEVIVCYTLLELKHKAAEIIRQEIDIMPTVKLYCLLGDATDDISCYEKAWKLSNHRSGRVQRHWGNNLFAKKQYNEAIPHLQKSLEINSLQEVVWLRLGYAALSIENWEVAAFAYRRYTHLEPYGFESWNNLAKAYIKLGDKNRAHKILQEALKCNFNNWKVWENFLFVSVDTGHFEDAINAFNRLIEIKSKYYDKDVLEIMVKAIADEVPDANGVSTSRLHKKMQSLLGHICVQQSAVGVVWELASMLAIDNITKSNKLQKAYNAYTQIASSWLKNPDTCEKVLRVCLELCTTALRAVEDFKEAEKSTIVSILSSARLSCQGCVRGATNEKWENCENLISELNQMLGNVTTELKKHL